MNVTRYFMDSIYIKINHFCPRIENCLFELDSSALIILAELGLIPEFGASPTVWIWSQGQILDRNRSFKLELANWANCSCGLLSRQTVMLNDLEIIKIFIL